MEGQGSFSKQLTETDIFLSKCDKKSQINDNDKKPAPLLRGKSANCTKNMRHVGLPHTAIILAAYKTFDTLDCSPLLFFADACIKSECRLWVFMAQQLLNLLQVGAAL